MNIDKKQLIKRNFDYYSELEFARKLAETGQEAFFPFKDKGVDIIGIDDQGKAYFYQLKARNLNFRKGVWGFKIDTKKLDKFPITDNSFWIFCALKVEEPKFDFFKIPVAKLKEIYYERKKTCGQREGHFIDIRKNKKNQSKWEFVSPSRLNELCDINTFLMK